MAAASDVYVVTGKYVLIKVRNPEGGGYMVREFFEGSPVRGEDVEPANLAHHLENELMMLKEPDVAAEPASTDETPQVAAKPTPKPPAKPAAAKA